MKKLRVTAILLDNKDGTPGEVAELLQHHIENEIGVEDNSFAGPTESRFKVDLLRVVEEKKKEQK